MKWFWGIFVAVVAAAGAGVAAYCYLRPGVDVTEVIEGPVVEAFYATGTVSAEHEYSVRSNVAGIIHLSVDKGSNVKRGQVLGVVDNADLRFAVDQARAELTRKEKLADDASSPVLLELRAKLQASGEQLQIALDDEKRVTALLGHGATS
jgi:multidrug efflux pump subunit AcrA (membrane-fusion protein)